MRNNSVRIERHLENGFTLGQWTISPLSGTFSRSGHDTHVEPKVMDVLLALARRQGEVVSRQDLLDDVWTDVVVTDDVLTRCISELRTLLGDTGKTRAYIRTIPKRGYSLLMPTGALESSQGAKEEKRAETINASDRTDQSEPRKRTYFKAMPVIAGVIILSLIAILSMWSGLYHNPEQITDKVSPDTPGITAPELEDLVNIRSVAVLPFANLSGNIEHEYFSDGLSEDIRNTLINSSDIRVAARTSSNAFKNRAMDVREIGKQLNVDALLEGTVRMINNELRVTAQLTSAADGYPIWSQSYQRDIQDKLALQSMIAQEIVTRLSPSLSTEAELITVSTNNVKAYEYYLLGRHHWHQRNAESLEQAIVHFNQARELDPEYALAYSGLADSYVFSFMYGNRDYSEALSLALPLANKAMELNPDLAEAHASLGLIYETRGDNQLALEAYQRTVQLKPQYAMGQMWLGSSYSTLLQADKALEHHQMASILDPLHPQVQLNYVGSLMNTGDYEKAEFVIDSLLQIESNPLLLKSKLMVYLNTGKYDDVLLTALSNSPSKLVNTYTNHDVVLAFIYLGRYSEAEQILQDMQTENEPMQNYQLSSMLAIAQRDADSLREIAKSYQNNPESKKNIHNVNGCETLTTERLLIQADFIEQNYLQVVERSKQLVATLEAIDGQCQWQGNTVVSSIVNYLVASSQALNLPQESYQPYIRKAKKELQTLADNGWSDPNMRIIGVTLNLLTKQFKLATEQLTEMQLSSIQPYGMLRFEPIFDLLNQDPVQSRILSLSKDNYVRMLTRSKTIELAKLGL